MKVSLLWKRFPVVGGPALLFSAGDPKELFWLLPGYEVSQLSVKSRLLHSELFVSVTLYMVGNLRPSVHVMLIS